MATAELASLSQSTRIAAGLQTDNERLGRELTGLERQFSTSKAEAEQASQLAEQNIQSLVAKIQELQHTINSLEAEVAAAKEAARGLEQRLAQATAAPDVTSERDHLRNEQARFDQLASSWERERAQLQATVERLQGQVTRLSSDLSDLRTPPPSPVKSVPASPLPKYSSLLQAQETGSAVSHSGRQPSFWDYVPVVGYYVRSWVDQTATPPSIV